MRHRGNPADINLGKVGFLLPEGTSSEHRYTQPTGL